MKVVNRVLLSPKMTSRGPKQVMLQRVFSPPPSVMPQSSKTTARPPASLSKRIQLFEQLQNLSTKSNNENDLLVRQEGFINAVDLKYMMQYTMTNLVDLLDRERKNHFSALMSKQEAIGRIGRAVMINNMFAEAQVLQIENKTVIYQAVSMMDRYYE